MRLPRRNIAVTAALAVAVAWLAISAFRVPGIAPGKHHVVHIRGMLFVPAKLEIAPGDSVEWVNDDVFLHAIKSANPASPWQSRDLPPHASWSKKFEGGDSYLCPYHPTMTGEILAIKIPTTDP